MIPVRDTCSGARSSVRPTWMRPLATSTFVTVPTITPIRSLLKAGRLSRPHPVQCRCRERPRRLRPPERAARRVHAPETLDRIAGILLGRLRGQARKGRRHSYLAAWHFWHWACPSLARPARGRKETADDAEDDDP